MDEYMVAYYKRAKIRRIERSVLYACLVAAGVFLTISPSPLVRQAVHVQVQYFFSISMILTGLVALWGNASDRWIGEYTALPLASGTMFFYGGTAFLAWREDESSYTLLGFALILIAFGLSLLARWRDIRLIKAHAGDHQKNGV